MVQFEKFLGTPIPSVKMDGSRGSILQKIRNRVTELCDTVHYKVVLSPQSGPFLLDIFPRLLERVRLAYFGRRNCYQMLSDVTGMPDISLPFCNNYDPTLENQPTCSKAFLSVGLFEDKKGNDSKSPEPNFLKFCDIVCECKCQLFMWSVNFSCAKKSIN